MMTEIFETYSRLATQATLATLENMYKIAEQNEKLVLQAIDVNRQMREQTLQTVQQFVTQAVAQQKVATERLAAQQKEMAERFATQQKEIADRFAGEVREGQKKATELIESATRLIKTK